MSNEKIFAVEDRAQIVCEAMTTSELDAKQERQLSEILYTLSEAGQLEYRMSVQDAVLVARAVDLVKAGGYTEDMRL